MTSRKPATTPIAPSGKLLYSGPAGKVWTDGVALHQLTAQGVTVMGVMAGGPHNQPSPEEAAAIQAAGQSAYGPLKHWMVLALMVLVMVGLGAAGAPGWLEIILGLLMIAAFLALPILRQFKAYEAMFSRREELTILLSDAPTQMVSNMIEVGPDTPAQTISPARQPLALVVRGLPLAERVKLAGGVTRHVALSMRGKKG